MMKRTGPLVIALAIIVIGGVIWADSAKSNKEQMVAATGHDRQFFVNDTDRVLPLQYGSNHKAVLQRGEPEAALKRMRTIRFEGDEGLQDVSVSFYESKERYFLAFLTDSTGATYHLTLAPGMEIEVRQLDQDDPVKAIVLSKSDTDDPVKMVIRRNTATGEWESWDFQGHTVQLLDLDRDGVMEWVGFDPYTVPPMTELHRWNSESQEFETTLVEGAVQFEGKWMNAEDASSSYLFRENGRWLFEVRQKEKFRFYRYEGASLREVELPDVTVSRASRLRSHDM